MIGPETDVPAGDIGVGGREIGFLYGMYKKLAQEHTGVLTGKGLNWGGSLIRPEATGFGCVYFANEMLEDQEGDHSKARKWLSPASVTLHGALLSRLPSWVLQLLQFPVLTAISMIPKGISGEKIDYMLKLRASNQDIVEPYAAEFKEVNICKGKRPWEVKVDIALPCATQNELGKERMPRPG